MGKLATVCFVTMVVILQSCDYCIPVPAEPCDPCIPDTIYLTDSLLFAQLYADFIFWRDSVDENKRKILDSLIDEAMDEVTEYHDESIYQVDTMRTNFLEWMDSIKGLQIYGNMMITPDTICGGTALFDSVTGKPYLKLD